MSTKLSSSFGSSRSSRSSTSVSTISLPTLLPPHPMLRNYPWPEALPHHRSILSPIINSAKSRDRLQHRHGFQSSLRNIKNKKRRNRAGKEHSLEKKVIRIQDRKKELYEKELDRIAKVKTIIENIRSAKRSPPPNIPIIFSQAAENVELGLKTKWIPQILPEGDGIWVKQLGGGLRSEEDRLTHVDEFVEIFFGLGLLEGQGNITKPLAKDPPPTQVLRLADIFYQWTCLDDNPASSILVYKEYGHILGKQLLTTGLNKSLTAESLYQFITEAAEFYAAYSQDLEDEAAKPNCEKEEQSLGRGKSKMGRRLKMVLGKDKVGRDGFPGYGRLIRDAKVMFALFQGAREEIGRAMERARTTGIES